MFVHFVRQLIAPSGLGHEAGMCGNKFIGKVHPMLWTRSQLIYIAAAISSVGKNSYVRHTCVIICVNTVLANPKFSWGNKLLTSSTPKLASTCQCTACAYIRITAASGGLKGLGWRTPIFLQVERSASVPMWSTSRPQSLSSHAAAAFAFARTVSVLVRLLL